MKMEYYFQMIQKFNVFNFNNKKKLIIVNIIEFSTKIHIV